MAGIRNMDRLVNELWSEVQSNPLYREQTTLCVLPEFGRDLDGSATNGFFNHCLDHDSTRLIWMMCLGVGASVTRIVAEANSQLYQPFYDFGYIIAVTNEGIGNYNSHQARIQKRYSDGLSFLAAALR